MVIIGGLLFINWSSEAIWQRLQVDKDPQSQSVERLALTLSHALNGGNITQLSTAINAPISLLNQDDVVWLDWQRQLLSQQGVVLSYDANDNVAAFVLAKMSNHLIKIGPFESKTTDDGIKHLILFFSYALLALVIALWLRPLWRDLNLLQRASERFATGKESAPLAVNKDSAIAPVISTFNRMTAQISRLIEEQKQLTNAVSHEIRTPLARLKFAFAMLDNKNIEQLPDMRQDVEELESLVDEMLSYGRLESQAQNLSLVNVDLDQLLHHQVEKLARHSDKKVKLNVEDKLTWRCDGHFIERASQNYITNALRYAKSVVHVNAYIKNKTLYLTVEDDGIGIKDCDFSQVFKAFTRLDKSRNKQQGGFGLGLAIVSRIVQWHQGQCLVEHSALGGAKFSIVLPLLSEQDLSIIDN